MCFGSVTLVPGGPPAPTGPGRDRPGRPRVTGRPRRTTRPAREAQGVHSPGLGGAGHALPPAYGGLGPANLRRRGGSARTATPHDPTGRRAREPEYVLAEAVDRALRRAGGARPPAPLDVLDAPRLGVDPRHLPCAPRVHGRHPAGARTTCPCGRRPRPGRERLGIPGARGGLGGVARHLSPADALYRSRPRRHGHARGMSGAAVSDPAVLPGRRRGRRRCGCRG